MTNSERPHILLRENLPPTIREYSGGGGGTYQRTSYELHANKVFKQADALRAMFAKLEPGGYEPVRGYFRVELPAELSITGSDGRKIEEAVHCNILGSPFANVGHFSATRESFSLLVEELQRYAETPGNVGKSKFAPIEGLGPIPLEEKLGPGVADKLTKDEKPLDVLLGLFPDLLNRERQAIRAAIEVLLKPSGGRVVTETDGESGTYLRIQAGPIAIRTVAETIIAVQSIDQTEEVIELSSRSGPSIESSVVLRPFDHAPIVCVIDSGVASGCRFIDPFVVAREYPLGPPHSQDHGTFVASRALYGDTIRDQLSAGVLDNRVRIVSVAAFTRDDLGNKIHPTTDNLIRIVRDTVTRWHGQVRVFNLSMNLTGGGASGAIARDTVSPLAAELDALSRRFGVLFVISSGNYPVPGVPPPAEPYPEYFKHENTRVLAPAEAMLALTVGSSAERGNSGSMVSSGNPSPFTRRGPGIGNYRKPDLIAHGGNYGSGWRTHDDLSVAGIGGNGDTIAYGCGTSYAAPIVTSLAAQILDVVPNATVELARALLVHFAEIMPEAKESDVLSSLVGNGRINPARILRSTPWEQTYVFMGKVDYRQIIRVPFFVPAGLTSRSMRARVRVRCTVAFTPETNRTLRSGYCKSHLRCKLIKICEDGQEREVGGEKSLESIKERYSTIVRLEKTFSSHVGPGDWKLLIEQESRWRLKDPNTPIAALITVEDPTRAKGVDIHAMIRTEARGRYMAELMTQHQLRV